MRGSLASSAAVGTGGAVAGTQPAVGGVPVALASGVGVTRAVGVGDGVGGVLAIGVGVGVGVCVWVMVGVVVAAGVGVAGSVGAEPTNANSVVSEDDSHGTCSPRVALMTPACVFRSTCSALAPGVRISRSNS